MIEALVSEELLRGAAAGVVGLMVVLGAGIIQRSRHRRPPPLVGVVLAVAVIVGMRDRVPTGVVAAVVLLAGAGLVADVWGRARLVVPLLALPGALALAGESTLAGGPPWLPWLVVGAVILGGPLMGSFDDRWRAHGYGPVLIAATAAGIYATVPDTEGALVVLGAAAVLAWAGWPWPLAGLGWAGSLAVTGVIVWSASSDGLDRPASIVGGVACFGLLWVEPLVRSALRRRGSPFEGYPGAMAPLLAAVAVHAAVVVVASRGAGLRLDALSAAVISGGALLLAFAFVAVLSTAPSETDGYPAPGG